MDATSPGGAVRIGVRDVGSRVVLRYRLPLDQVGPHGETLTDVIGVLEEWSETPEGPKPGLTASSGSSVPDSTGSDSTSAASATVVRASGERVVVPLALIVAAKVLPPAPMRRREPPQANNQQR